MLKQDSESVTIQDKETFLLSVIPVFFSLSVFSIMLEALLRETSKITMEAKKKKKKKTFIMLDSYLRSCFSLAGMVYHLDLLNYGEAVNRLSNCLLPCVFPYIYFIHHSAAAVSVSSIP